MYAPVVLQYVHIPGTSNFFTAKLLGCKLWNPYR